MARISPFQALRAQEDQAESFSASAYDSEAREDSFRKDQHADSYLHILLPHLFSDREMSPEECHQSSVNLLSSLLRRGVLMRESSPSLYIYRQIKGNNTYTAFIGLVDVDEYRQGLIKKHELTRSDKESKITSYFREVGINGSPVLLTYPAIPKLDELVSDVLVFPAPVYHFVLEDHIEHMLWRVDDPAHISTVQSYFAELPALYIADGHHRCAALGELYPDVKQFMACLIPDNQIQIRAFHRYVTDLGMTAEELVQKLGKHFDVEKSTSPNPETAPGILYMYAGKNWYKIGIPDSLKQQANPKYDLDVYILDHFIFGDILNIENTRTSNRLQFINGEVQREELIEAVDAGRVEALFLLHPTEVHEVMQVADYGETMPPKSTWIEPKLRSGLLIHQFKNLLNL